MVVLAGALLLFAWATPSPTPSQPCIRSCHGVTRRLEQSDTVLRSALYRRITEVDTIRPLGYWSMEDPVNTAQTGAAVTTPSFAEAFGGPPIQFTSAVRMASQQAPGGSAPLPNVNEGIATGYAATRTASTNDFWAVQFAAVVRTANSTFVDTSLLQFSQGGSPTWASLELWIASSNGAFQVFDGVDGLTKLFEYIPTTTLYDGVWRYYTLTCEKSGTSVIFRLYINDTLVQSSTVVSTTMGAVSGVLPMPDDNFPATSGRSSFGHLGVYDQTPPTGHYTALIGHTGETRYWRTTTTDRQHTEGRPRITGAALW